VWTAGTEPAGATSPADLRVGRAFGARAPGGSLSGGAGGSSFGRTRYGDDRARRRRGSFSVPGQPSTCENDPRRSRNAETASEPRWGPGRPTAPSHPPARLRGGAAGRRGSPSHLDRWSRGPRARPILASGGWGSTPRLVPDLVSLGQVVVPMPRARREVRLAGGS